jgi:hypothetical protein
VRMCCPYQRNVCGRACVWSWMCETVVCPHPRTKTHNHTHTYTHAHTRASAIPPSVCGVGGTRFKPQQTVYNLDGYGIRLLHASHAESCWLLRQCGWRAYLKPCPTTLLYSLSSNHALPLEHTYQIRNFASCCVGENHRRPSECSDSAPLRPISCTPPS